MNDRMVQNELRHQLEIVERYSAGMSGLCKPRSLHRVRSAILRLAVLLKYARKVKCKRMARRLMKCRKAMAYRRDCDVCWARVKAEMHASGFPKESRRRIRQAIETQQQKAQRKLERILRVRRFEGLLSDIHNVMDRPGELDVNFIHRENIIYQRPNEWDPGRFHQIRKRLRIINYVHDLLAEKGSAVTQNDNDNWIDRYQNVLGDYIDGSNTVAILKRLKKVKKRRIERLINKEVEKMQKCRWLIKSMPWPDTVSFSRTVFQESYL